MENLLGGARKLKVKIIEKIGPKIPFWVKIEIKRQMGYLKGSLKDPLLYLELLAIILFMVIFLVAPSETVISPILTESPQGNETAFLIPGRNFRESPDLSLIQKNSLAAISPPILVTPQVLGALSGGNYEEIQREVIEYMVEPGDTLSSVAEKFNISLNTLLWANDLNQNSLIQIGQKLIILPVSGVLYHVQRGDTLSQIAKTYKAEADKIIAFNDLSEEGDIYIGDILIIPDGVMPPPIRYAPPSVPLAQSYFICPISSPCRITQGLHWYNAIDFSHGKCGELVFAPAAGEVLKVKLTNSTSRWAFGGQGNHLAILHPNGVVTYYGHIQTSLVNVGDRVYQGQIIALVGGARGMPGAGNSTGCHLHFGVSGARNPFAR